MPLVQTFIARKAVGAIEGRLDGEISFEKIHLQPFRTLLLKNVLIIDRNPVYDALDSTKTRVDTLFRAEYITAKFSFEGLVKHQGVHLRSAVIENVSSWIVMEKYAAENEDILERYLRALYKAKDFRANPDNAREISEWIAAKCGLDVETVYSQRGDAEWLTAAEMLEMITSGKMEALYKSQQNGFIASGAVEGEVPVANYVMFDLMKKAAQ